MPKRGIIDDFSISKNIKAHAHKPDGIKSVSVPSLESMCLFRIASALSKQSDVTKSILEYSLSDGYVTSSDLEVPESYTYKTKYFEMEERMIKKTDALPIPKELKLRVSNLVRPVQLQALHWICQNPKKIEYIESIFWSTNGRLDEIKTLKHLILKDSKGQYVESNYRLACKFCMTGSIYSLWNKLSKGTKSRLCSKRFYKGYFNHLIAYWSHYNNNDLSSLLEKLRPYDIYEFYNVNNSINMNMFEISIHTSNILGVKYFWNKLTFKEVCSKLRLWVQIAVERRKFTCNCYQAVKGKGDVLFFLLSKMKSETERNEVLQDNPDVVLNSLFFDWPWQRFLLPTIKLLWAHFDEEFYASLLNNVALQIKENKTTEFLFRRLWTESPLNFKQYYIQKVVINGQYTNVFCNLLIVGKVGTVVGVLKYANPMHQKHIIHSLVCNVNFVNVVYSRKLHLFDELCVDMFSQSEIKLIKECMINNNGNNVCQKLIKAAKFDEVDAFLNWSFNTQEQIQRYKVFSMNKIEMAYSLLYPIVRYELVNTFLTWCFGSEKEINKFKTHFAHSKPELIEIGRKDWHLFEKFVDWCFNTDEEIQNFKKFLSKSYIKKRMENSFSCQGFCYNLDFFENVINWCFNSPREKKEFKANLALSKSFMDLLLQFFSNSQKKYINEEAIKELFKLVAPLDEDVVLKLKELIASAIDFPGDYTSKLRSYGIQKEQIFCLLEKHCPIHQKESIE